MGYEYHLDSALVKPTQERWLKLQDLTARCLMSLIGLLTSTEKMVPEGRLHMRPFSVSSQGALEISSVAGQPPSLDRSHCSPPRLVAKSLKRDEDLHPKDYSIQLFTDASNEGWGAHLDQNSTKGLWSDREKRLHIYVLELKAVSLALRDFKDQCQNQTVLVATDNSTVVAYINNKEEHTQQRCVLSCGRS